MKILSRENNRQRNAKTVYVAQGGEALVIRPREVFDHLIAFP